MPLSTTHQVGDTGMVADLNSMAALVNAATAALSALGTAALLGVSTPSGVGGLDANGRQKLTEVPLSVLLVIQLPERSVSDGVLNTSTTVTSATAAFTSAITGSRVIGAGIPVNATATFVNATTITLSAAATATATGVVLTFVTGAYPALSSVTNDTTRMVLWRGAIAPTQGGAYMLPGVHSYESTA